MTCLYEPCRANIHISATVSVMARNRPFILYTPFQIGSIEAKKGARQKFVHFWKALTILMLKKYLKS